MSNLRYGLGILAVWGPMLFVFFIAIMQLSQYQFVTGGFLFCLGLVLLWQSIPTVLFTSLEIYINKNLLDRQYSKIDLTCTRTLKIANFFMIGPSSNWQKTAMLTQLGRIRLYQGHFESAEDIFFEALTVGKRIPRLEKMVHMAVLHLNVGVAKTRLKKYEEAEIEYELALDIVNRQKTLKYPLYLAVVRLALGANSLELGQMEKAEENLLLADTIIRSTPFEKRIPATNARQSEMASYLMLALLYARTDRLTESIDQAELFLQCCEVDRQLLITSYLNSLNSVASVYIDKEKYVEAEKLLRIAYIIGRELTTHPDAKGTLDCYERLLKATDRRAEIEDMRSWLLHLEELLLEAK